MSSLVWFGLVLFCCAFDLSFVVLLLCVDLSWFASPLSLYVRFCLGLIFVFVFDFVFVSLFLSPLPPPPTRFLPLVLSYFLKNIVFVQYTCSCVSLFVYSITIDNKQDRIGRPKRKGAFIFLGLLLDDIACLVHLCLYLVSTLYFLSVCALHLRQNNTT
jgi:hypothetical protein